MTEESLGDWPYRVVNDEETLIAFGEWLQQLGAGIEKTPVGISGTTTELALATKEQGWFFRHKGPGAAVVRSVLKKALTAERTAPALVTRDIKELLYGLGLWLEGVDNANAIIPNIVHDMTALEYATGRSIARNLPPLKDALDCTLVGPMMALEAPQFYRDVGMPLAKHMATFMPEGREENRSRWALTYDYLLFKVLAHYTQDPLMYRWFQDGLNPLREFSRAVDLDDKAATAFLLWMVCGEDEALLAKLYPGWATEMPDAPQLVKAARIDKNLPNLRLGLIRLTDQMTRARRSTTMYGRRSVWGLPPSELLHFSIMGSVTDLLDVAVVSIARMGSDMHWMETESNSKYNHFLRATIVGYTEDEPMEWEEKVEELGRLNNPLGNIELKPRVTVG